MESSQSKVLLIFAYVGLILLLFIGGYLVEQISEFYSRPPSARLQILWQRDLERLKAAHALPKSFSEIKTVELTAATDAAKEWQKTLKNPITVNPAGKYRLEILLLSWEEGDVEGAIIQYNLVNLTSMDMEWELGRTFILKGTKSSEESFAKRVHNFF